MAAYVYRIVAKPITARGPDGAVVTAHPLRFIYKMGCDGRAERMIAGRADAYWRKRGAPSLIVVGDAVKEQAIVYHNPRRNGCVTDDAYPRYYRAGEIVQGRFVPWWTMVLPSSVFRARRDEAHDLAGDDAMKFWVYNLMQHLPPGWTTDRDVREYTILQGSEDKLRVALTLLFGEHLIAPNAENI